MDTIKNRYEQLDDETLCQAIFDGDSDAEEALVGRYVRLVRVCARPLFLAGGDNEDLFQEGMLGLLGAIRSFNHDRDASFRTYAGVCIRNRLFSAVKAAGREKHSPLNHYVSFETPLFDETNVRFFSNERNPEDLLIGREEFRERLCALESRLSSFEAEVLFHYLDGFSCAEIARQVGRTAKAVDNAVQRIRKKLRSN